MDRRMTVAMPPHLFEEFDRLCEANCRTVSEVVRQLIVGYVRREKTATKKDSV